MVEPPVWFRNCTAEEPHIPVSKGPSLKTSNLQPHKPSASNLRPEALSPHALSPHQQQSLYPEPETDDALKLALSLPAGYPRSLGLGSFTGAQDHGFLKAGRGRSVSLGRCSDGGRLHRAWGFAMRWFGFLRSLLLQISCEQLLHTCLSGLLGADPERITCAHPPGPHCKNARGALIHDESALPTKA